MAHDTDARSICGKRAPAEHVGAPAVAQCDDEQLGAVQDALDLERQELVTARAQRFRCAQSLLVDEGMDVSAQRGRR